MKVGLNTMQIQLESSEPHTIKSYDDKKITVNGIDYHESILITKNEINPAWSLNSVLELNENNLDPLLVCNPEVILIGHQALKYQIPPAVVSFLASKRIGIECMSIGAACRTFNVLLGEGRMVVLGILFERFF